MIESNVRDDVLSRISCGSRRGMGYGNEVWGFWMEWFTQPWGMDVYGCKEQDLTSSQVSSWIRVLGLFWLSLGQLAGVYILYVCYIK